jgi:hypothetical protein
MQTQPKISNNNLFTAALSFLLDRQAECSCIHEDHKPAYEAAEAAISAAWTAVCAISDAHAAQLLAQALRPDPAMTPEQAAPLDTQSEDGHNPQAA